jgi:hypothetical protein
MIGKNRIMIYGPKRDDAVWTVRAGCSVMCDGRP